MQEEMHSKKKKNPRVKKGANFLDQGQEWYYFVNQKAGKTSTLLKLPGEN